MNMEWMLNKVEEVMNRCVLFRGIDSKDMNHLLQCLGSNVKEYKDNEYVFFAGDEVNHLGIVLKGSIEVMKENLAGNKHIVAFIQPSQLFAEGIVCTAARISPVTVRARETTEVLCIPYDRVVKSCGNACSFHVSIIRNMMMILGEKNVILNRKLEILTLKGMREKLASYLLGESIAQGTMIFQIVMNRTELADYLNVSRTSMCRELTRMKEEKILDYYGNSFKILDKKKLVQVLE